MTAKEAAERYLELVQQDERTDRYDAVAFAMRYEAEATEEDYEEYLRLLEAQRVVRSKPRPEQHDAHVQAGIDAYARWWQDQERHRWQVGLRASPLVPRSGS